MKKRYILLGTLLLLPTMVNAESLTTTIKCDPIKFGQTANCKIIGTTKDYVSSVEYVLNTTDNHLIFQLHGKEMKLQEEYIYIQI